LFWIGSSRNDLKEFPEDVQDEMGYALYLAQVGDKHAKAKPMEGFGGGTVLEVVDDYDDDTYRGVYTVRFADVIYVLHAFQKKSKHGIKTPRHEIDLIKARLRQAEKHYEQYRGQER